MEPFVEKEQVDGPKLLYIENWMKKQSQEQSQEQSQTQQSLGSQQANVMNYELSVGFTTRVGGASEGEWASLNVALHVNDKLEHVIANRELVAKSVGYSFDAWTCAEQVHSNKVYHVTLIDRGKGRLSREAAIQETDALVTNERDVLLVSFYADCVPLYFWDESNGVIGLAHAGWKGTVTSIAAETIQAMVERFGCRTDTIRAAIGPAIGSCCYEVDHDVIKHVRTAQMMDGAQLKENGRYWLDLKQLNRQIMIKAGILPKHIELSAWCTSCHPERFYSHRRDNGKTGRMMSWIGMK